VDITPISEQAATDQSLTASDGLHPSGKQYMLWAQLLAPKILAALK
jgi:lysophospholipase L1-like esterase